MARRQPHCEDRKGYRILRSTVTRSSLGDLTSRAVELMRDVRADMYGIRTFLRVDGQPVKFSEPMALTEVLNDQ